VLFLFQILYPFLFLCVIHFRLFEPAFEQVNKWLLHFGFNFEHIMQYVMKVCVVQALNTYVTIRE
jgi:hypothetical protein